MKAVGPELLAEITNRLVAQFSPQKIILFGSHAWGTPHEDSDLDICVIVRNADEPPTARMARAYLSLAGITAPTEIIVQTESEVNRYRSVAGSLTKKILENGKILYG